MKRRYGAALREWQERNGRYSAFVDYSCELVLNVPLVVRDLFRVNRLSGNRVTIAKPPRQIAVLAPLRAEGSKGVFSCAIALLRDRVVAWFLADRAGFG